MDSNLTPHPLGTDPTRLTRWKEIWNTLVAFLLPANPETVPNMESYQEHTDFRKNKIHLKTIYNGGLGACIK